jgi:thioredoxin 1
MSNNSRVEPVDIFRLEELINSVATVICDFWAPWCAPCLAFADVFEKVANEELDIVFLKMNIQEEPPEVLDSLGIMSVPHLMIFKDGVAVYSEAGTLPYAVLKDLIAQTRQLQVPQ